MMRMTSSQLKDFVKCKRVYTRAITMRVVSGVRTQVAIVLPFGCI